MTPSGVSSSQPELVDWEALSEQLDRKVEQEGGLPARSEVKVDHCRVTSETELW